MFLNYNFSRLQTDPLAVEYQALQQHSWRCHIRIMAAISPHNEAPVKKSLFKALRTHRLFQLTLSFPLLFLSKTHHLFLIIISVIMHVTDGKQTPIIKSGRKKTLSVVDKPGDTEVAVVWWWEVCKVQPEGSSEALTETKNWCGLSIRQQPLGPLLSTIYQPPRACRTNDNNWALLGYMLQK